MLTLCKGLYDGKCIAPKQDDVDHDIDVDAFVSNSPQSVEQSRTCSTFSLSQAASSCKPFLQPPCVHHVGIYVIKTTDSIKFELASIVILIWGSDGLAQTIRVQLILEAKLSPNRSILAHAASCGPNQLPLAPIWQTL